MRETPAPAQQPACEPDLQFGPLCIWVHGREFPHLLDWDDGNWLIVTILMDAPGARVIGHGPVARAEHISEWLAECARMESSLQGSARLICEGPAIPEFDLQMRMIGQLGHIKVEVEMDVRSGSLEHQHHFWLELDQSYLRGLVGQGRQVMERFPVCGKRPYPDA